MNIYFSKNNYVIKVLYLHCPRFLCQGDPKKNFGVKKMWRKNNGGFHYSGLVFFLRQPGVKKEYPEIY